MYNYSIIIPHYNLPKLIVRCLNSIPVRDDIEIIVVDDCSDSFQELCNTITELNRNITILSTPHNGGAGLARNIGLDHAQGKWIVFVDADDLLTSNAFDIFDKYLDSTADSIIFNSKSVMSDDLSVESKRSPRTQKFLDYLSHKNDMLRYGPAQPWGRMIRRTFIEEFHFRFPEVRWSEDLIFAIKTSAKAKEFLAVNEIVYIVTEREGSNANTLSNRSIIPSLEECKTRFDQCVDAYKFLIENGIKNQYVFLNSKRIRFIKYYPLQYYWNIIKYHKKYAIVYFLEFKFIIGDIIRYIKFKTKEMRIIC